MDYEDLKESLKNCKVLKESIKNYFNTAPPVPSVPIIDMDRYIIRIYLSPFKYESDYRPPQVFRGDDPEGINQFGERVGRPRKYLSDDEKRIARQIYRNRYKKRVEEFNAKKKENEHKREDTETS